MAGGQCFGAGRRCVTFNRSSARVQWTCDSNRKHKNMPNNIDLRQLAQSAAYGARAGRENSQSIAEMRKEFQGLAQMLSRVQIQKSSGDPNIQRVENIPGRRTPMTMLVDIAIPASDTGVKQGSITVNQEGVFIATARMATLQSTYAYTVTPVGGGAAASFYGRSYGRYRPIHSAWDLNDGRPVCQVAMGGLAFPGTGAPFIASPSNLAPFRSMEGDFRIRFTNAGASMPRSNLEVPSTFWTKNIVEPFPLACLDFFERGEVMQFRVAPQHANNPEFGNLTGFAANPNFPFAGSQWDAIEGIDDSIQELGTQTTDPVTRVPNAILTIGFEGYLIQQPAGAGQC